MKNFDREKEANAIIEYLKNWFNSFGNDSVAVIGISGGKDSAVSAGLLVKALGAERVRPVLMPNGEQKDISDSQRICDHLGIRPATINIEDIYSAAMATFEKGGVKKISDQLRINLAPRIRMMTLYAVAQGEEKTAFVVNTCNRSEDYVGYSTKYGDAAGDISVLQDYTVSEVLEIGDFIGLPYELVHKAPSDGLCGKTDEDNLGFTYADLDSYIKWKDDISAGEADDLACPVSAELVKIIEKKHKANLHKLKTIPSVKRH